MYVHVCVHVCGLQAHLYVHAHVCACMCEERVSMRGTCVKNFLIELEENGRGYLWSRIGSSLSFEALTETGWLDSLEELLKGKVGTAEMVGRPQPQDPGFCISTLGSRRPGSCLWL